jgi:mRNA-degrading endonuclease YafQ of YafQ-DinJ toxin-antitoxin module
MSGGHDIIECNKCGKTFWDYATHECKTKIDSEQMPLVMHELLDRTWCILEDFGYKIQSHQLMGHWKDIEEKADDLYHQLDHLYLAILDKIEEQKGKGDNGTDTKG